MTREEKIKAEAKKYYKEDIKCYDAFLHGVEFAENNQWISVEDDLPRNHKELIDIDDTTKFVLVLDNGLPQVTFMYKINNGKWVWAYSYNVTHWMPIPKLDEYNIND